MAASWLGSSSWWECLFINPFRAVQGAGEGQAGEWLSCGLTSDRVTGVCVHPTRACVRPDLRESSAWEAPWDRSVEEQDSDQVIVLLGGHVEWLRPPRH